MDNRFRRNIEIIDGIPHYSCNICNLMKSADEYTKNSNMRDSVHYTCRECVNKKNRDRKTEDGTRLDNYKIELVKNETIIVLKNLGFDLDGDISEQFLKRVKERYNVDLS